jgi:hypothetical protein
MQLAPPHDLRTFRREHGIKIVWGRRRAWKEFCWLGSYRDGVIRLHPALKRAPRFVLLLVIYHERLHAKLGPKHSPELMRLERRHRYYKHYCEWLKGKTVVEPTT